MNGAKKGQKPKKPIKQKPVKALTGLEIALIGGAAGLAGSMLGGGGKKAAATPLNNPAAMIAPLSGFVGKKDEEEKPGMKEGGSVGERLTSEDIKSAAGVADTASTLKAALQERVAIRKITPKQRREQDIRIRNSQKLEKDGAPPMKGPMSEGMMGGGMMYNDAMGMKDGGMTLNDKMGMEGGETRGQKDIQVKKKIFKGIF